MEAATAEAEVLRLANRRYENFPVAAGLLPRDLRRHLRAIYAYCRTVDDLGDEAPGTPAQRLRLLDVFEAELRACLEGRPASPLFRALRPTVERFSLPIEPFARLIEANRRDQRVSRYPDYAGLLDYCANSANPVGDLVLRCMEAHTPARAALSDAVCTALQLANFWQDVARDCAKGRIYIPQEDMARFGVSEAEIAGGKAVPAFRRLLAFEVERTRALFRTGLALPREIPGAAGTALLLFIRGGWGILRKIERAGFDTLSARPVWGRWERRWLVADTWLRRGRILADPSRL